MISVKQVISSIKLQLRLEATDSDAFLEKIVNEGCRHIDALEVFAKFVKVLNIKDGEICLPTGFKNIIGLRLGTEGTCEPGMYVDLPFLKECGCAPDVQSISSAGVFEVQNDKIVFHSEVTATEATVAYIGLNLDSDGLQMIPDDWERCLTAYGAWRYTQSYFEMYPANKSEEYRLEFVAQKKWIKGKSVQDHFRNTRRQVAEIYHALLSDKVFNV